jgi:hypothetical protein
LIAERLATAGGKEREHISPRKALLHDLSLQRTKRGVSEGVLEGGREDINGG